MMPNLITPGSRATPLRSSMAIAAILSLSCVFSWGSLAHASPSAPPSVPLMPSMPSMPSMPLTYAPIRPVAIQPMPAVQSKPTVTPSPDLKASAPSQSMSSADASMPDPSLMSDYERRIFPQAPCEVDRSCTQAQRAKLVLAGGKMALSLEIHAMERSIYPLPSLGGAQWINMGKSAQFLRASYGGIGVLVEKGVNRIELVFEPQGSEVVLSFANPPSGMSVDVEGWRSEMPSRGSVQTVKLSKGPAAEPKLSAPPKPSQDVEPEAQFEARLFIDERRHARFDANGADVETTFTRLSPTGKPATVLMELMPGEKVLTEGAASSDGASAKIDFPAGVAQATVTTRWEYKTSLTLTAHGQPDRRETWIIEPWSKAPIKFGGVAPINAGPNSVSMVFMPKPGEKLTMAPQPVTPAKGAQIAVDSSELTQSTGEDRVEHAWTLTVRSTIAAPLEFSVPKAWRVESSSINGRPVGLSRKGEVYVADLAPGQNLMSIKFSEARSAWWWTGSPSVELGAPAANLRWSMLVPQNQWVVWTFGPLEGPAVLIWGVLAAMGALSFALSRKLKSSFAPSFLGWLGLLIPLSALSPWLGLILVFFVIAMSAKSKSSDMITPKDWNKVQLGLIILGILSALILLAAVYQGLLGEPDMMVRGPGSYAGRLTWYQDMALIEPSFSKGLSATVVLAPIWLWRSLMLAWALWIAASVAKRLPSMWSVLCLGGFWRGTKK